MLKPPRPRRRAREVGIDFPGLPPGQHNAITDVPGVTVGHTTLFSGEGKLVPGSGPIRTGCTAVVPAPGNLFESKVPAAVYVLNGFGKPMGFDQARELGELETPILLTNTLNVPRVADGLIDYLLPRNEDIGVRTSSVNVFVGECNDGHLNDMRGRHVGPDEVFSALEGARGGSVPEGVVGAGTGMRCMGYKGGIGTASRRVQVFSGDRQDPTEARDFTTGVLVLANFGRLKQLRVAGVPVGHYLAPPGEGEEPEDKGSIVMVVATDAPLDSRQLKRLARRAGMGLARTGSTASHGSGDFVVAFSNAYRIPQRPSEMGVQREILYDNHPGLNRLLTGVVEATEEAILNALFVADTVVGRDGHRAEGLPVDEVLALMRSCGGALLGEGSNS